MSLAVIKLVGQVLRGGSPSWRPRMVAVPRPSVVAAMTTATKPGIFPDGMGGIHAFPWDPERGHTLAAGTWDSERHTRLVRMVRAGIGLIAGFLFSRQGAETPAAGIFEFGPPGCPYARSPQVPVPMVTLR